MKKASVIFFVFFLASCQKQEPVPSGPVPVDLGLSVMWASCNFGASAAFEYGDYYAWGEKEPKDCYDWAEYAFSDAGGTEFYTYTGVAPTGLYELVPDDDVVRVKTGGKWRMPTRWELWELTDFILYGDGKMSYETVRDASGKPVHGARIVNTRTGKSIFLPSAGRMMGRNPEQQGLYGYYWTTGYSRGESAGPDGAYCMGFEGTEPQVNEWSCGRYYGMPIRPVMDF